MSRPNHLLAALGKTAGLPELCLDEAGGCTLAFDDVGVQFTHLSEANQLLLCSPLGHLPGENAEPLLRTLMSANVFFRGTQGATLGADAETGLVTLCYLVNLAGCDESQFVQLAQNFIRVADSWQRQIADQAVQAAPSDGRPPGAIRV